jgi:hypothetical protein
MDSKDIPKKYKKLDETFDVVKHSTSYALYAEAERKFSREK